MNCCLFLHLVSLTEEQKTLLVHTFILFYINHAPIAFARTRKVWVGRVCLNYNWGYSPIFKKFSDYFIHFALRMVSADDTETSAIKFTIHWILNLEYKNVNFIDQEYVLFSTLVPTSVNTDCVMTKDPMDPSLDKRVSFSAHSLRQQISLITWP